MKRLLFFAGQHLFPTLQSVPETDSDQFTQKNEHAFTQITTRYDHHHAIDPVLSSTHSTGS